MRARTDAVPALVKGMAAFFERTSVPRRADAVPGWLRLQKIMKDLTSSEMQPVWSRLKRARIRETYVCKHWALLNAGTRIPDGDAAPVDKAVALVFYAAVIAATTDFPVYRRSDVERAWGPLLVAARINLEWAEFASGDPDLANAYKKAGEDLKRRCEAALGRSPFILDRPAAEVRKPRRGHKVRRRDPRTRARVVMLAEATGRLYHIAHCGTVAEIAAVALRDASIDRPTVTKWYRAYRRGPAAARENAIPKKRQKKFSALPGAEKPSPSTLKS
jgi:hypothetical protein